MTNRERAVELTPYNFDQMDYGGLAKIEIVAGITKALDQAEERGEEKEKSNNLNLLRARSDLQKRLDNAKSRYTQEGITIGMERAAGICHEQYLLSNDISELMDVGQVILNKAKELG